METSNCFLGIYTAIKIKTLADKSVICLIHNNNALQTLWLFTTEKQNILSTWVIKSSSLKKIILNNIDDAFEN